MVYLKNKCNGHHLVQLGYLPPYPYGDAWIVWIVTAMLKGAYERQLWWVPDLPAILKTFVDPDPSAAGDCATRANGSPMGDGKDYCAVLLSSPCHRLACRIGTVDSSLQINSCGTTSSGGLYGEVIQEYC